MPSLSLNLLETGLRGIKIPAAADLYGVRVHPVSMQAAGELVFRWAAERESRSVVIANVHVLMMARDNPDYRPAVNGADLVVPDGMPLVWALRQRGLAAERVVGADLTIRLCAMAAEHRMPVFFYGSTPDVLARLAGELRQRWPDLRVETYSPPFRPLTPEEDAAIVERINASRAGLVFVGLGAPKQEQWMAAHRGRIRGAMLGIGAAFDFLAGNKRRAPGWMQQAGLEWLFRLAAEPRRLWRRYVLNNPRFLLLLLTDRLNGPASAKRGTAQ